MTNCPVRATGVMGLDARGELLTLSSDTFRQFCDEVVGPHTQTADKRGVSLILPALFDLPGGGRNDGNVAAIGRWWVADIDKASDEQVMQALGALSAKGWAHCLYSSHNHGVRKGSEPHTNRVRVLVELDRELSPAEWKPLWDAMNAIVGGISDPACRKLSQPYYKPSCPPGSDPLWSFWEGAAAPVDELVRASKSAGAAPTVVKQRRVSRLELEELAKRLLRQRTSSALKGVGAALARGLAGEPIAEAGSRDETLWALCATVVDEFPDVDAAGLAEVLEPGLTKMSSAEQVFGPKEVADKVERHRAGVAMAKEEAEVARRTVRQQRILESTGGRRDWEATPEELDALCKRQNVDDVRKLTLFWVRTRWAYFQRADGSISPEPVAIDDLVETCKRDLAVYPWFDSEHTCANGITRDKTANEMRADYGGLYSSVEYDITAAASRYDNAAHRLTIAPTPLRVQPQYSEVAAGLIAAMDPTGKLKDWVASSPRQDKPTAMLVLCGPRGTGKTLLCRGLARMRCDGPPSVIETMSANFNSDIIRSGYWLEADEALGEDYKRRGSQYLRSLLSVSSRTVNVKYSPEYVVTGYPRVVVTTNSLDVMETRENLTSADLDALSERVLLVQVGDEAKDYLTKVRAEHGLERVNALVQNDELAAHALWLRDNHKYIPATRFLVEGGESALQSHMAVSVGSRGDVIVWLLRYLQEPIKLNSKRELYVRVRSNELWANATGIEQCWDTYLKSKPPSLNTIGRALGGLSYAERRLPRANGIPTDYKIVNTQYLMTARGQIGMTEDELIEVLSRDTEDLIEGMKKLQVVGGSPF